MSYILEALKKSQRDRELGQAPDVTAESYPDSSEIRPGMNPWIISSVVIALLALLIALYGVFGRQLLERQAPDIQAQTPVLTQPQNSSPPQAAIVEPKPRAADTSGPVKPAAPEKKRVATQAHKAKTTQASAADGSTSRQTQVEKTQPETAQRPDQKKQQAQGKQLVQQTETADMPEPLKPAATAEKRGAVQEPVEETPAASVADDSSPRQAEVEKIRREYAQMLAREKQQEQEKQREKQQEQEKQPVTPPQQEQKTPPAIAQTTTKTVAMTQKAYPASYELPAEVQSRLPPRNIMLHSYSEDPAQRFVILNSAKLYQGQVTPDGLQVVEIRVDGLLLAFEGYEFFHSR